VEKASLIQGICDFILYPFERPARIGTLPASGAFLVIDNRRAVSVLGDRPGRANPHDRTGMILGAEFASDFYHIDKLRLYIRI
jgi:hypothetical protein